MLPIEVEIDKRMRKLYFLRRLINIGAGVVYRGVLFIRSARWKWNHKIKMTDFVTDIVDVLEKYELLHYLLEFVSRFCLKIEIDCASFASRERIFQSLGPL